MRITILVLIMSINAVSQVHHLYNNGNPVDWIDLDPIYNSDLVGPIALSTGMNPNSSNIDLEAVQFSNTPSGFTATAKATQKRVNTPGFPTVWEPVISFSSSLADIYEPSVSYLVISNSVYDQPFEYEGAEIWVSNTDTIIIRMAEPRWAFPSSISIGDLPIEMVGELLFFQIFCISLDPLAEQRVYSSDLWWALFGDINNEPTNNQVVGPYGIPFAGTI